MADVKVSEYELKVLRYLVKWGALPLGDKRIAWAGAARRLERKGLTGKGERWYITSAGRAAVEAADKSKP